MDSVQTAQLFVDTVFRLHGLPTSIVSDRDPRLVASVFFTALSGLLGTKQLVSTSFHPQTDGQSERTNRIIEDVLRNYVSIEQTDWDLRLSAAEFAINNSWQESTKTTPFRMVYGRDPHTPIGLSQCKYHEPQQFADKMVEGLANAKKALQAAQERQKRNYDSHHRELTFERGDEVVLNTKNIKLTTKMLGTPKFLPKWLGPFCVNRAIGKAAYLLDLPEGMGKVHPVFHVSLLKKWVQDPHGSRPMPPPAPFEWDKDVYYEVDQILDHKDELRHRKQKHPSVDPKGENRFYLCKWKGYSSEFNSWEPAENVNESALAAYLQYLEALGPRPGSQPARLNAGRCIWVKITRPTYAYYQCRGMR